MAGIGHYTKKRDNWEPFIQTNTGGDTDNVG